jgi:phytoene synthase
VSLIQPDEPIAALIDSRRYCRELTKAAARNFYYGLRLLPEPKRSAMFTLYAYMRLVDDIADEEDGRSIEQRTRDLENWRLRTHDAIEGNLCALDPSIDPGCRIWPAFCDLIRRYNLPAALFDGAIAGQQRDLTPERFETFDQLHEYCYQVAGVVGLGSIHIWGFGGGAQTEQLAIARGVALQLTNILRDLREDAARGRIYIPQEDMRAMGVSEEDLLRGRGGESFRRLMAFQIERAVAYYEKSRPLDERIAPDSRPTLVAMTEIYHRLLHKVAAEPERVLRWRVSLSPWSKLTIGWRAVRASRAAAAEAILAAS